MYQSSLCIKPHLSPLLPELVIPLKFSFIKKKIPLNNKKGQYHEVKTKLN